MEKEKLFGQIGNRPMRNLSKRIQEKNRYFERAYIRKAIGIGKCP